MLSQNQEALGKNLNANLNAVMGAFQFTDAHLHISRRLMNDMALGRLRMLVTAGDAPESIDYEWYFGQYQLVRGVVLFFRWVQKMVGMVEGDKEETKAETTEPMYDVEDLVFGGDYAGQNAAPGESHREDGQGSGEELSG